MAVERYTFRHGRSETRSVEVVHRSPYLPGVVEVARVWVFRLAKDRGNIRQRSLRDRHQWKSIPGVINYHSFQISIFWFPFYDGRTFERLLLIHRNHDLITPNTDTLLTEWVRYRPKNSIEIRYGMNEYPGSVMRKVMAEETHEGSIESLLPLMMERSGDNRVDGTPQKVVTIEDPQSVVTVAETNGELRRIPAHQVLSGAVRIWMQGASISPGN